MYLIYIPQLKILIINIYKIIFNQLLIIFTSPISLLITLESTLWGNSDG